MVHSCFVPDCHHNSKKNACSFLRFPKSPGRKERWTNEIGRVDRVPSAHSLICSCHFSGGVDPNRKRTPRIFKRNVSEASRSILFPSPLKKTGRKKILADVQEESVICDASTAIVSGSLNSSDSASLNSFSVSCGSVLPEKVSHPRKRKFEKTLRATPEPVPWDLEEDDPVPLPESDPSMSPASDTTVLDQENSQEGFHLSISTPALPRGKPSVKYSVLGGWCYNKRRKLSKSPPYHKC